MMKVGFKSVKVIAYFKIKNLIFLSVIQLFNFVMGL